MEVDFAKMLRREGMRGRAPSPLLPGDVEVEEELVLLVIIEHPTSSIEEADVVGVDLGAADP